MSNATFSRKPLVAAVLTTLAVFSTGTMAANGEQEVNKDVTLTVGTGANNVPNTIKDEKTWDEDWAKTFNKDFTNASGKVTISTLKTRKPSLGRSSKARNLEKPLETGAFRLRQVSVYYIICTLTLEQNSWQPPRNTLSKSARFPSLIKRRG